LSEVLWTPEAQKDFSNFTKRLKENIIPRYGLWESSYFTQYEKWGVEKQ
jgi:hypothetical protein